MSVSASRLRMIGVSVMPHGVKFRSRPMMGRRARLMPKLREMRSIASRLSEDVLMDTCVGKRALITCSLATIE